MGSKISMEAVGTMIDKQSAARYCLLFTSIIQTLAGILAIVGWSIMLAEDHGQHPRGSSDIHVSPGIWAGAIVMVAGILGLLAALRCLSLCTRAGMMYGNFGATMAIWGTAHQVIQRGLKIYRDSENPYTPPAIYWTDPGMIKSLALMEIILGAIFYATAISVVCTYAVIHYNLSKERRCASFSEQGKAPVA